MKNINLLKALSMIDEKYITDAAKDYLPPKRISLKKLTVIGIAACICIFATAIWGISALLKSANTQLYKPTKDTIPKLTQKDPEPENQKFDIKDGVLLSYNGTEKVVVIPEEVKKIPSGVFNDKKTSREITSIHIGSNVEYISDKAFESLSSLESISINSNNKNFEINSSGCLQTKDKSVVFVPIEVAEDEYTGFYSIIKDIENNPDDYGNTLELIMGRAIIRLNIKHLIADWSDNPEKHIVDCYFSSITAYGHTKIFDGDEQSYGNFQIGFIQTEDTVIISKTSYSIGYKWIFTEDGFIEIDDNKAAKDTNYIVDNITYYDISIINFEKCNNDKIGYIRQPYKWLINQDSSGLPPYQCVSRDEFAREEGYATFENGEVVLHPEKNYTVEEWYDLDELFDTWVKEHESDGENFNDFKTIDEIFEYNSKFFKRAK